MLSSLHANFTLLHLSTKEHNFALARHLLYIPWSACSTSVSLNIGSSSLQLTNYFTMLKQMQSSSTHGLKRLNKWKDKAWLIHFQVVSPPLKIVIIHCSSFSSNYCSDIVDTHTKQAVLSLSLHSWSCSCISAFWAMPDCNIDTKSCQHEALLSELLT